MFAAWRLAAKAGAACEITIYEASDRLGGKVKTNEMGDAGLYEAGVAEIYDYSRIGPDPLRTLIEDDLGLSIRHIRGGACFINGQHIPNVDALAGAFGQRTRDAAVAFQQRCAALMTPAGYYTSSPAIDNAHPWTGVLANRVLEREVSNDMARRYFRTMLHSDISGPTHLTDGLNLSKNALMDVDGYIEVYSVDGGNEEIVDRLEAEIDAAVELNAKVASVAVNDDGSYKLTIGIGITRRTRDADMVVVALPAGQLSLIEWDDAGLGRRMREHIARFDHPGHYLRATLLFDEPYWRSSVSGAWWMQDTFGGCCVYDEGARHEFGQWGALGFLLAGNGAVQMGNLSDEEIIAQCLDSLPACLGEARAHFVEGRVHRWIGAISALPGGRPLQSLSANHRPALDECPGLFLVGDYLFDSTLNGALDSADTATDMLLGELMAREHAKRPRSRPQKGVHAYLDAPYLARIAEVAFGLKHGDKVLHYGSGAGELVEALRAAGFDAYGVEEDSVLHDATSDAMRRWNKRADLANTGLAESSFDFIFETCLTRGDEARANLLMREARRLARCGLMLGSATTDLSTILLQHDEMFKGAGRFVSRSELAEVLFENGFELALLANGRLEPGWALTCESPGPFAWFDDMESLLYGVFKVAGTQQESAKREELQSEGAKAGMTLTEA